jgi:hypothetical protein
MKTSRKQMHSLASKQTQKQIQKIIVEVLERKKDFYQPFHKFGLGF